MATAGYAGTASCVREQDGCVMPVAFRLSSPGEAAKVRQAHAEGREQ